ncbi:MAG TPA: endospore germination permease [Bacillota bacterium]|nr:endospore germination permease [Candidatus Fermentithermobacillaceae bacterium]HOA70593.1 endospore germination permease [Bacillota bacterium]HPZ84941.1 endospore germination permease [Bacillota bacterium]HQD85565.1 endospore germination permease [Bacillota bacterium]
MKQLEKGRISSFQYMCMLLVVRITATTVTFPFMTDHESPTDAWIGAAIGIVVSLVLLELIVRFSLNFPNMTVIQYSQSVLGKFLGSIAALLLIGFWVFDAAVAGRAMGSAMVNAFMPETPVLVFIIVTAFLSANGARQGLEITARWSELVAVGVVMSALLLALPFQAMNFQNLLPILPYGIGPHLKRAAIIVAIFLRYSVVGMIVPYVHNRKEILRYTRIAVLISGAVLIAQSIVLVAVFGARATSSAVPTLQLVRQITIGEFFERIEIFPVTLWLLNNGVNMGLFIWASSLGLAQLFGLNRFEPLTYPIGGLVTLLSMLLFKNYVEQIHYLIRVQPIFVPVLVLGVYALLYAGFSIRKLVLPKQGNLEAPMILEAGPDEIE